MEKQLVAQSCPALCDPMDWSPPDSSVHWILQARIQEWAATSHRQLYIMKVKVTQSCPTLCHSMDFSPPGSTVHGISRQEYWSGLPFPSVGDLPNPGIDPRFPVLQAKSFLSEPPENPKVCVLAIQLCPTLCNPMDCSLPASSVHGILQTRILE